MRKWLAVFLLTGTFASAESTNTGIRMPDVVLDAIRNNECLKEQGVCNPNVIRINAQEDIARAVNAGYDVQGHLIRCISVTDCTAQAQSLINGGIVNLDLGPYQINYKYHPNPMLHEYFDHDTAREHANRILTSLVKTFGYSWETLGRYHHAPTDPARNAKYYRKMYAYIYGNQNNAQGTD